jgi:hypothetical protein
LPLLSVAKRMRERHEQHQNAGGGNEVVEAVGTHGTFSLVGVLSEIVRTGGLSRFDLAVMLRSLAADEPPAEG